jgi:D-glycero-alpha-D-manno-heptose 1-phosphate guanylyltransferase
MERVAPAKSCEVAMKPHIRCVVLAGGLGTRLRQVVADVPKPMAPVGGKPFLCWQLAYLRKQGFEDIVLSVGHRAEVIEEYFTRHPLPVARLVCVREAGPLGTGGAFRHVVAAVRGAVPPDAWLVLNGDSLALTDMQPLVAALAAAETDGALLAVEVPDAARYGSLKTDATGYLLRFSEKHPGSGCINAGVYLLRDRLLDRFPQAPRLSFEADVFPALLAGGCRLRVVAVNAPFLDIGTPESWRQAEDFVSQNAAMFETDSVLEGRQNA